MFGQLEWSLRHEALKYIYTKRMKKGTFIREHVLDMMMYFSIAKVNRGAIDEANQENSSWKRLSKVEITFKDGTSEMVSAEAVGDLKLYFGDRYSYLRMSYNKVFVSTNATFLKEDHIKDHQSCSKLVLNEIPKDAKDILSSSAKVVDKTKKSGQPHPSQELKEPLRSGRVVHQPDRYLGVNETQVVIPNDGIEDLLTHIQAMNDVDLDQWITAMDIEMELMYFNSV
ncbi:gag/pol protein [Cucumis melo var. makuwa]|uniref:Gag/pol protein n=1 Tax=Cucumis melo var. makuwa TaxID=1194695 RepID=A0A5D3E072_CUCMM|nr:gag/pol protein [Cucumis melo var. makuwa]